MRASTLNKTETAASMGLGFYICRCIAKAHQGTIGANHLIVESVSPCAFRIVGIRLNQGLAAVQTFANHFMKLEHCHFRLAVLD
jgi:hypothetical protein